MTSTSPLPAPRNELQRGSRTISEVSTFRLYLLRATYLLILVGLGFEIWPGLLRAKEWDLMRGVVSSVLTAVSVLAAVGIRYPLQMLPLLLFELVWKSIWVLAVALPLWSADQLNAPTLETVKACLMGIVILPLVIPWPFVIANYVRKPGDPWR